MRGIILAILCIFVFIFVSFIGISITDQATRSDEAEAALEDSILDTMEVMHRTKEYTIHDVDEFMKDFCETFAYETSSNSAATVNLLAMDEENGFAMIEVKTHFMIATGKTKTITKQIAVDFEKWI